MCWAEKNSLTSLQVLFGSQGSYKIFTFRKGTWLAQSADHVTLDLRGRRFRSHVGGRDYLRKIKS